MKELYLMLTLLLAGQALEFISVPEASVAARKEVTTVGNNASDVGCQKCAASEFGTKLEPDTAFNFTNGRRLLICGYYDVEAGRKVFSEFVLSECGDRRIIDFWEAAERYEIEFKQDTLKLHKVELLALGDNRELVNSHWLTEYYYYKGNRLKRDVKLSSGIKYSQHQIMETLREYENMEWQAQDSGSETDMQEKMALGIRLLIASMSGSYTAETYLEEYNNRLKAEATYTEKYRQLLAMQKAAKRGK
ncbi:hypothetical protein [Pontibacter cellulosilyticus]|uniref:RGS domain-containing protein n=1 Tax=Pontibacter cellulosilyticus TaxID=1720253 RepID=A0A923NDH2_9BACT|nr:hypothetical protein [Pontibacter cellulosilyticus]MBC5994925.1 hypothetical protein [Pontibacter cellulosilyticus]